MNGIAHLYQFILRNFTKSLIILCLLSMTIIHAPPRSGTSRGSGARMGGGGMRTGGVRPGGTGRSMRAGGPRSIGAPRSGVAARQVGQRRIGGAAIRETQRPGIAARPSDTSRAGVASTQTTQVASTQTTQASTQLRGTPGGRYGGRHGRYRRHGRLGRGYYGKGRHRYHRSWGWWGNPFWYRWPLIYPFATYYSGPSYCYVINNAPYAIRIQPYGYPSMTIDAHSRAAVPCVNGLINDISYIRSNQIVVGDDGGTIFISDDSDYE